MIAWSAHHRNSVTGLWQRCWWGIEFVLLMLSTTWLAIAYISSLKMVSKDTNHKFNFLIWTHMSNKHTHPPLRNKRIAQSSCSDKFQVSPYTIYYVAQTLLSCQQHFLHSSTRCSSSHSISEEAFQGPLLIVFLGKSISLIKYTCPVKHSPLRCVKGIA